MQVTQSTQSIMTSGPTQATPMSPQPSNMDMFEKEKAEGNKHIQKVGVVYILQAPPHHGVCGV